MKENNGKEKVKKTQRGGEEETEREKYEKKLVARNKLVGEREKER